MATALLAVFILAVSVSLAVAGLVLAQRRIPLELRQSHNVAIGVVYGALQITFGAYERLVAGMKELRVVPADWDV